MNRCLFIMNPNAGQRQGRRWLPELLQQLTRSGYLCTVFITEKRGDAQAIVLDLADQFDLIVACGGDGTLNEVIAGLQLGGHQTPIGYLPCGSTNDFASGIGLPTDLIRACEEITSGTPSPLDIGRFGPDRFFSYTASFGAFTSVSYSTPQNVKNILGYAAYILEGIRSLSGIHPIHMKMTAGETVREEDYIFGSVCNSTSLGGLLKLDNSMVHMNDGLFEALLIPFPADLGELNAILQALYSRDFESSHLTFVRAPSFVFECDEPLHWTLDGEEAVGETVTQIVNLHHAISLVSRISL